MKNLLSLVLFFILGFLMMWIVHAETIYNNTEKVKIDYYYSPTCNWCKKLDEYIEVNDISSKVEINKIDIRNQDKWVLFVNTVEELGLNSEEVWIPFIVYTENGKKEYVKWWYYGWIWYFSELLEEKTTVIKSKEYFQKQKIVSKNYLNKNLQTQKYINTIDILVSSASDKELESVAKKLENLSYLWKSEKITNIFKYLEAKISEELSNKEAVVQVILEEIKDFWNWLKLEQSDEKTYLTHHGIITYIWEHKSKTNPFIWDEACSVVWEIYTIKWTDNRQWIWDNLSNDEQEKCLKEYYWKNISVSETINKDFIKFHKQWYEYWETYLLDINSHHVIDLNSWTEVYKVIKNEYGTFILHGASWYWTAEIIFNNGEKNIVLFENNNDIWDINDSEYRQITSFLIIDNKIEIEYIGQYGNSKIKIINLEM